MARTFTHSFTSASISASSSLEINQTTLPNACNIVRIKVTPSIAGVYRFEIYRKDTYLAADLLFTAGGSVNGTYEIPKNPVQGSVAFYEDLDVSGELHIKIYNDDASNAKTFAVEVDIEEIPLVIYKTVDESVNSSTTTQNDEQLFAAVQADRTYQFEMFIWVDVSGGGGGGIKVQIDGPTNNNFRAAVDLEYLSLSSWQKSTITSLASTVAINFGGTSGNWGIIVGTIETTAAGTLRLKWAQQTSDADNTTVKRGSYMKLMPIV